MSYQNPPTINKDGTAVPLGMTTQDEERVVVPSGHRLSTTTNTIVAAGMLLLMVAGGGAVWMQEQRRRPPLRILHKNSSGRFTTVDGDLTSEYGAVGDMLTCWSKDTDCLLAFDVCKHNCCNGFDTAPGSNPVGTCK